MVSCRRLHCFNVPTVHGSAQIWTFGCLLWSTFKAVATFLWQYCSGNDKLLANVWRQRQLCAGMVSCFILHCNILCSILNQCIAWGCCAEYCTIWSTFTSIYFAINGWSNGNSKRPSFKPSLITHLKRYNIALCVRQCNFIKNQKLPKVKKKLRLNFSSEIIQTFFKWCKTS